MISGWTWRDITCAMRAYPNHLAARLAGGRRLHTRVQALDGGTPLCDKANVESAKCDVISGFPAAPGLHSTCYTSTFAPEHPEAECPLPAILY
jgi:hypothetical protein